VVAERVGRQPARLAAQPLSCGLVQCPYGRVLCCAGGVRLPCGAGRGLVVFAGGVLAGVMVGGCLFWRAGGAVPSGQFWVFPGAAGFGILG
jgi:hypothetical protein